MKSQALASKGDQFIEDQKGFLILNCYSTSILKKDICLLQLMTEKCLHNVTDGVVCRYSVAFWLISKTWAPGLTGFNI
jgi:hypothetical protein